MQVLAVEEPRVRDASLDTLIAIGQAMAYHTCHVNRVFFYVHRDIWLVCNTTHGDGVDVHASRVA